MMAKLLDHLPTDKYVPVKALSFAVGENVSRFLCHKAQLLESLGVHSHQHNCKKYLCYSGPDTDPPVKRGMKFKDCVLEDTDVSPVDAERFFRQRDDKRLASDDFSRAARRAERSAFKENMGRVAPRPTIPRRTVNDLEEEIKKLKDTADANLARLTADVAAAHARSVALATDLDCERQRVRDLTNSKASLLGTLQDCDAALRAQLAVSNDATMALAAERAHWPKFHNDAIAAQRFHFETEYRRLGELHAKELVGLTVQVENILGKKFFSKCTTDSSSSSSGERNLASAAI